MSDPLDAVHRLLGAIETQQSILEAHRAAPTISEWLRSADEREAAERELRRLLEQLGAAVADGVRAGRVKLVTTQPGEGDGVTDEAPPSEEAQEPVVEAASTPTSDGVTAKRERAPDE